MVDMEATLHLGQASGEPCQEVSGGLVPDTGLRKRDDRDRKVPLAD